jgi:hypothetical protein
METLLQGMLSKMGEQGIEKLGKSAGLDSNLTKQILSQAGPLLMGKMADNAKSAQGRESLARALDDHDESIFDKLDDIVNPNIDTKGSGILSHILGDKAGMLAGVLAKKNGTDSNSTQKILEMAAPLILGQLGGQKKAKGLDAGGIFDMLQGEKKASGNSMILDLTTQFLDKDKDGSIIDDLLGMAGKFLNKK